MTPIKVNYFSLWHVDISDDQGTHHFRTQLERIFNWVADYFVVPKTTLRLAQKMSVIDAIHSFAMQRGLTAKPIMASSLENALVPIIAKNNSNDEIVLLVPQGQGKYFVFLHNAPGYVVDKEKIPTLFSEFVLLFMAQTDGYYPTAALSDVIKRFFPKSALVVASFVNIIFWCGFFLIISRLVALLNTINIYPVLFGVAIITIFIFLVGKCVNFMKGKNYSNALMLSYSMFYQRYLNVSKEQFSKLQVATMLRLKNNLRNDITRFFFRQSIQFSYLIIVIFHLVILLWWKPILSLGYAVLILLITGLKQWIKNKRLLLQEELEHISDEQSHFLEVLESTFSMLVNMRGMKPLLTHITNDWKVKRKASVNLLSLRMTLNSLKVFVPLFMMTLCLFVLSWWNIELGFGAMLLLFIDAIVVGFSLAFLEESHEPLRPETIHALAEIPTQPSGLRVLPVHISGRIELINVSFNYIDSGVAVLKQVSVAIESGEFYQILGPSGAGKSTLLKLMTGFIFPTSGHVLFDGQDMRSLNLDALRSNCGVIAQESRLFLGSVYDNIVCGRDIGKKKLERLLLSHEVFDMLLDLPMGLQSYVFPQKSLSQAQTLTVLLARALIHEPKILFMDEIFKGIDEHEQKVIVDFLKIIPITRILVTHHPVDVSVGKIINIQSSMIKKSS